MKNTRTSALSLALLASMFLPALAFAQGAGLDTLGAFLQQFIVFIDAYLVPLLFAIAFIVFIWGIFQYFILGGANEEKREQGRSFMLWGIIGFFIMVSIWGILNLLVNSFGFGNDTRPPLPTFESEQSSGKNASKNGSGGTLPAAGSNGTLPAASSQVTCVLPPDNHSIRTTLDDCRSQGGVPF